MTVITQLPGIQPEIAVMAIPDDERVWVPQARDVWFRPLLLNTTKDRGCRGNDDVFQLSPRVTQVLKQLEELPLSCNTEKWE